MTFTPAIPLSGLLGWRVFNTSEARQLDAFANSAEITRNIDYFKENAASALTAQELVDDRRLLTVALGAYGLEEEIDKKAFVRRVLEEGTLDPTSFANRLPDPRWKEFADAFGYDSLAGPRVTLSFVREEISERYIERAFEVSVGEVNADMRLAMNFRREIETVVNDEDASELGWLKVLGQPPLRAVVEATFGLPGSFGATDLDQQVSTLEQKSLSLFGDKTVAAFQDSENVEAAIRRFFLRRDLESGPGALTPGVGALSILSASPTTSFQTINLLLSNAG